MKISFIGSGAWASALANVVSDNNHEAYIYGIDKNEIDDININHQNKKYFNELKLNDSIKASLDLKEVVIDSDIIVLATPSSQIRKVLGEIEKLINSNPIILNVFLSKLNDNTMCHSLCHEKLLKEKYLMV